MNWLLLVLSFPSGVLLFLLGDKICRKWKTKSATTNALIHAIPLAMFCLIVIIVDVLWRV